MEGWQNISNGARGTEKATVVKVIRKHYAKKLEPFVATLKDFTAKHEHKFFCMLLNPEYCNFAAIVKLVGSGKAKLIREEAKTALAEYMLKHEEFKNGVVVEGAQESHDVGAAAANTDGGVSDNEDANVEVDGASMRGAMRKLMKEKLTKYLKFARQAANWQRPLPKPDEPEGDTNERPRFDCLAWWDLNEMSFPELAAQHDMWNSCPPAEESCERMFSIVGILYGIQRRKMDMENMANLVYLHQNWPNDATLDFDLLKGVDPGFSKDYQLPVDWNEYLKLEADMIDEDWEHLSVGNLLDVEAGPDEDGVSDSDDDDAEPDLLSLPYGMRLACNQ